MGTLLIDLLPLTIGAAVLPVWIIMAMFLLRSANGLRKAMAFVGGATAVRLLQGVLFGFVFGTAAEEGGGTASAIKSTLLLVVGILMLLSAVKKWRKEEDPDGPPPKWMAMLDGLSAGKAFGVGALLMAIAIKQWVFTLSAIAIIEEAQAGTVASVLAFLYFVVLAQSLIVAPIIVYAVAPTQSGRLLDAAQGWLERHNRTIIIAVSLVFGLWFLWKGITGLLS
jgi:hypothetical protein